ncbi:Polysaccharide deacetylase [Candidatus Sulfobium mesophilum]|uniref:Polysaccharide deacetylase n=1 Tax=Candidatus Sulfobium mesophilum TaxID=2016548 RepID=A0A2U3QDV5_9BACT|nr:Polysaccharide deacetylase [Candidatus Sulfobium mesophilum]
MVSKSAKQLTRDSVYVALFYSGAARSLTKIVAGLRREHPCVILAYHRIVDDHSSYLNRGPAMHHRMRDFEKEIDYFGRNFDIVSMDEVVQHVRDGAAFRRPSLAITFDDGYLDNYTLAYPVLKKYGVPATIYLTTGLIGTEDRTWPDQIEYALLTTGKNTVELPSSLGRGTISLGTRKEKEMACLEIGQAFKLLPNDTRKRLLEELFHSLGLNGRNPGDTGGRVMLNWDEVREMAQNGVTIGCHSHTHPILSRMPLQEAKEEIRVSKELVEENLGREATHFAIPNGGRNDFTEELKGYCREIGFESVTTLMLGTVNGSHGDAFALRRLGAMSPLWMLAGILMRQMVKG